MKPRNLYVNTLFDLLKNENLPRDEKNRRAKIAIEAIVAAKPVYEKFKQDNPELKIDQADEVSLDASNEHGSTPLTWAAEEGHTAIVEALLAAKADPNKMDGCGATPIIWAVARGYTAIVEALVKAKADLNTANKINGDTVFISAVLFGHIPVVEVLLAAKVDINVLDKQSKSALDHSIERHSICMVHLLLKANAKVNHFENLRKFLLAENQGDPRVIECFMMMQKNEAIQVKKLCSVHNLYEKFFSYFVPENLFPRDVTNLILAYDGRFFQSPKLPPMNISEPGTIDAHVEELKKEISTIKRKHPG